MEFPNRTLNGGLVIDPPRDDREVRKWMHPLEGKGKEHEVVVRNTVLDGAPHLLRGIRDSATPVRGVVAYREGVFPVVIVSQDMPPDAAKWCKEYMNTFHEGSASTIPEVIGLAPQASPMIPTEATR